MRAVLALVLSLLLALASQTEAVARSEMAGAQDQVLCGALGAVSVMLDASGHRITARSCTHCIAAAAVMADLARPDLVAPTVARFSRVQYGGHAQPVLPSTTRPVARGPPRHLI
jgi:hypothetical protein